jgi:hypothetical protein
MLKFFSEYRVRQEQRREFLGLLAEVKSNLELYYVMFQLGKLRFFVLDFWETIKTNSEGSWNQMIPEYIRRLTEYNRILKEYKDFEFWYNDDLDRKNKNNGCVLHQKKELAQVQFQGLEPVIKDAVSVIEQQAILRKIIKANRILNV